MKSMTDTKNMKDPFSYDQTEYEFEVNAQNGDIIEWSEEKFD